jgi:CSLREA domain-containing protein
MIGPPVSRLCPAMFLLAVLTLVPWASAEAATFTVDSTLDTIDASLGDGVCADSFGRCTLRAAIMEANRFPNPDRIDVPAGVFLTTIPPGSGDGPTGGDLDITSEIELHGAGAHLTFIGPALPGVSTHRVFDIGGAFDSVRIRDVTVRNGSDTSGGGIRSGGSGDVTIVGTHILDNQSTGPGAGIRMSGTSTVDIIDSTISDNLDLSAAGDGGAIFVEGTVDVNIFNTTVSGNRGVRGVAVKVIGSTQVVVVNSTIAFNSARPGGTLVSQALVFGGDLVLLNTILAAPSGSACEVTFGSIVSVGFNLITDGTCSPVGTDIIDVPNLGGLAFNLGTTPTHALLAGSPAIAAGNDAVLDPPYSLTTDQRGVGRPLPSGTAIDIGAYEFDQTPPVITPPSDQAVEAEGPDGTPSSSSQIQTILDEATAEDPVEGSVPVTNDVAAGFVFLLDQTTEVTYAAEDSLGNTASATSNITVSDTLAPDLTVPADITTDATSPSSAVVSFSVSAADVVDPDPLVECGGVSLSGGTFSIGTTTVTCTATDFSSNSASASFDVTVVGTWPVLTLPSPISVLAEGPLARDAQDERGRCRLPFQCERRRSAGGRPARLE